MNISYSLFMELVFTIAYFVKSHDPHKMTRNPQNPLFILSLCYLPSRTSVGSIRQSGIVGLLCTVVSTTTSPLSQDRPPHTRLSSSSETLSAALLIITIYLSYQESSYLLCGHRFFYFSRQREGDCKGDEFIHGTGR